MTQVSIWSGLGARFALLRERERGLPYTGTDRPCIAANLLDVGVGETLRKRVD